MHQIEIYPLFQQSIRASARKFSSIDFFLKILPLKEKKRGGGEHPNLSKSGFVSEENHSGCKSQNIEIRALTGNVLCQIWFKWTCEANLVNWWRS